MRDIQPVLTRARAEGGDLPLPIAALDALMKFASVPGRSVALAALAPDGAVLGYGLDEARPGASTLKLAVAAAAFHEAAAGRLDLDRQVAVDECPPSKWPSVLDALEPEATLRLRDLCAFAITSSDNGATQLLMRALGPEPVAAWLRAAGCGGVSGVPVGYDDVSIETHGRANLITARDAVIMLRALLHDPLCAPVLAAMINNVRNQRIPRFLDDDVWVAHKTGSLNGVVNDVAIISAPYGSFILCVLCDGQSDVYATETATARLAEHLVALGHL